MHFRITYDGPALTQHEMDVRDLAPALLALADLCEASSEVLYGNRAHPAIRVRASFRTGSFGIDLTLASLVEQVLDFFSTRSMDGAGVLATLVTTIFGLIHIRRKIAGRNILRVERQGQTAILILEGDGQLAIEDAVLKLLQSRVVVEHLAKVLDPLQREGIDTVAFGDDKQVQEMVDKADLPYFAPIEIADELLSDDESQMAFSIVSPSFKADNKWRLADDAGTYFVSMEDPKFVAKVEQHENFAKGDLLICRVRRQYWQHEGHLRSEYTITKVLEHRHVAQQVMFPITSVEHPETKL